MTIEYLTFKPQRSEPLIRELATCLAIYACTSQTMLATEPAWMNDELYLHITMNLYERSIKERWKQPFSGCAYLCQWVLECSGFANVNGIGRTGKADNPLSRLAWHEWSQPIKMGDTFMHGDTIQIGDDLATHIYMAVAPNSYDKNLNQYTQVLGAHYGQEGVLVDGKLIGGTIKSLSVSNFNQHRQNHGKRPARRLLSLSKMILKTETLSDWRIPKPLALWLREHQPAFKEALK